MTAHVITGATLVVTLGLSLFFLAYCLRNDDKRGAVPLAVMFVGVACWVFADTLHVVVLETNGNPMVGGGLLVRVLGIELTVIGMLLLGLSYTGRDHLVSVQTVALLLVKPLLVLGITASPLRTAVFSTVPAATPLGYEILPTPGFLLHVLYSYGVAAAGVALLGSVMIRSPSRYRLQSLALFVAVAVPFSVSILYQSGFLPFDMTPVSFGVSALLLMTGTFRLRLLDTIPIARQRVIDVMDDPVVVLDENQRIVMGNDTATTQFGSDGLVGTPGTELFGDDALAELDADGQTELVVETNDGARQYSVTCSEVGAHREAALATVLVCRDVTDQRQRQRELRQRESELELLKDLQSRVLRHNLRNELNVVRTNAALLVDDDNPPEPYEELIEKTDRLIDWSQKARTVERLVDVQDTGRYDLAAVVEPLLADARERYPEVTFEGNLDPIEVIAVPQIEQAIENLLDNAARYNTAADPLVTVRAEVDGDHGCLYVTDNGPGIDEAVVSALGESDESMAAESGFGLWMVYWVIEKSGGDLSFDSTGGPTVSLRFERAESLVAEQAASSTV
ncbi:histidine kinase N-terminal 7TM domain-containing protein [Halovenus halobia]|uniref:histidine kinase N-terminal 7TM domain-containing protein n=1 Tax=Halovenus halobia TaxID=3396622 RepID=UPI003F570205